MYYAEQTDLSKVENLLYKCSLSKPEGVDYTAGIYSGSGELIATGSLKIDELKGVAMIQGVAVDPAHQGEDLMGKLMTHLLGVAEEKAIFELYLFTKPEKAVQFQGLGFRLVASARPYAALLEWGRFGIDRYLDGLRLTAKSAEADFAASHGGVEPAAVSALVMNCNPFTLGHRYLVEQAAATSDIVYLLVVEEDKSLFSFKNRFEMVRRGVADLENVVVIPGGRYAVSSLTFPSYFTKEENLAKAHTAIDAEIFCRHIAPALRVTRRFLGTEPLSAVTNVYNETLKERLPRAGIEVTELTRLEKDGQPVSASRVRALLGECLKRPAEETLEALRGLLPTSSLEYMLAEVFHD